MSVSKGRERIFRDDGPFERRFDEAKFLKNRLIVNNLDDKVALETVEDKFSIYGKVLGVSQHRTFTYIQFDHEAAALAAIKDVHNSTFRGKKLDVRLVKDSRWEEKPRFSISQRDSTAVSKRDYSRDSYSRSSYRDRSPAKGESVNDLYSRDGDPDQSRHVRTNDKIREHGIGPKKIESNRPYSSNPYEQPNLLPPKSRTITDDFDRERSPQGNDCEIIVCSPELSDYTESLEQRLKCMGMKVDILFPKENSPILQILEDISARRCLYALVVTSQNEMHKSITVNILYGTPQEHRNMPREDAMLLISRNFDNYKREMAAKKGISRENNASAITQPREFLASPIPHLSQNSGETGDRAPPILTNLKDMQLLFRLLANGKRLTLTEFDRVIAHLQDCRDRLFAENRGSHSCAPISSTHLQDDLVQRMDKPQTSIFQEKILSLMTNQPVRSPTIQSDNTYANRPEFGKNKWGNAGEAMDSIDNGHTAKSPTKNAPFINFDNPSIKKALDSLIQTGPNLLRSLGAVSGGSNTESLMGGDHYRDPKPYCNPPAYPTNAGANSQSALLKSDPYYYQRQFYN